MSELAVLTPSYAPDFEMCKDLHHSVLEMMPPSVVHYIVVPDRDRRMFDILSGQRCKIMTVSEILPKRFIAIPGLKYHGSNFWINLRYPFPPVRGWIMQQIITLIMPSQIDARTILRVDSDTIFIRPVDVDTFRKDGILKLYRKDFCIDQRLPHHIIWHNTARKLLGLPISPPPFHDYINAGINVIDRDIVLALKARIENIFRCNWVDVICKQLHFSEFTLHGVFVDEVCGPPFNSNHVGTLGCHSSWSSGGYHKGNRPRDLAYATAFVCSCQGDDIAVMLSKLGPSIEVRRAAFAALHAMIAQPKKLNARHNTT